MSKNKPDERFPPKTETEELFDAILGPDEEISQKVADDIIETYEITREQLVDTLKVRLQERIKEIRDETGTIPRALEAMLTNVREYQREKAPKSVDADEWVADIFSGDLLPSAYATPLYDLRNRAAGEVSENDRRILNEITAELEDSGE